MIRDTYDGKLGLSFSQGGHGETRFRIELSDAASGVQLLEVYLPVSELGSALSGAWGKAVTFSLHPRPWDYIGARREIKTEAINVPDGPHVADLDTRPFLEIPVHLRVAVMAYRVDGWEPRWSDLQNSHTRIQDKPRVDGRAWHSVNFVRYVRPDGTPILREPS